MLMRAKLSPLILTAVLCFFLLLIATAGCGEDDESDSEPDADDDQADDDVIDDDMADDDAVDDDVAPPTFLAGAARIDITPDFPVILGGYGMYFLSDYFCRWSEGSHDPIYATAIAMDDGAHEPVIQIALDVIGLLEDDTQRIQDGIAAETGVDPEHVIISASHSHATPDTVGIYGVMFPPKIGRIDAFIELMISGAIEAGTAAYLSRQPATVKANWGYEPNYHFNFLWDTVDDAIVDSTMTVLGFYRPDGTPIATMTNWGSHPTVLPPENVQISADFIGGYYEAMDEALGGVNMFANGNMGASVRAMNAYDPIEPTHGDQMWGDFEDAFKIGRGLAETAQSLLDDAAPLTDTTLTLTTDKIWGQLRNPLLSLMKVLGMIAHDFPALGEYYPVDFAVYRLGPVVVGTVPGELAPNIGLELRDIMDGDFEMIVNIGQDWVGYILTPEQYRNLRYIEYSFVCPGPGVGDALLFSYQNVFESGF